MIRSTMIDVTKRSSGMSKTSSAPSKDSIPKSNAISRSPLKDQVKSGGADKSMGGKRK